MAAALVLWRGQRTGSGGATGVARTVGVAHRGECVGASHGGGRRRDGVGHGGGDRGGRAPASGCGSAVLSGRGTGGACHRAAAERTTHTPLGRRRGLRRPRCSHRGVHSLVPQARLAPRTATSALHSEGGARVKERRAQRRSSRSRCCTCACGQRLPTCGTCRSCCAGYSLAPRWPLCLDVRCRWRRLFALRVAPRRRHSTDLSRRRRAHEGALAIDL